MAERGFDLTLKGADTGTVGNVISLTASAQTCDAIDISDMDSSNNFREFLSGLKDAGDISLELTYDGTASGTADALFNAYTFGTTESWTIAYMGTTSDFEALGFISSLGVPVGDFEGKVTQSLTIKFTGVPEFTKAGG